MSSQPSNNVAVALCPPAVRMVGLLTEATWDEEKQEADIHQEMIPIIALRTVIRSLSSTTSALIQDRDKGIISTNELCPDVDDPDGDPRVTSHCELYTCEWDPSEDNDRLSDAMEEWVTIVTDKVRSRFAMLSGKK